MDSATIGLEKSQKTYQKPQNLLPLNILNARLRLTQIIIGLRVRDDLKKHPDYKHLPTNRPKQQFRRHTTRKNFEGWNQQQSLAESTRSSAATRQLHRVTFEWVSCEQQFPFFSCGIFIENWLSQHVSETSSARVLWQPTRLYKHFQSHAKQLDEGNGNWQILR